MATFWDCSVTDTILIDLSDASAPINWATFSDGILKQSGTVNSLSELTEQVLNHKVIVWIAGDKVTLTSVTVPTGQQRHLYKILPSLLEDSVASDIDQLHFAIGNTSSEGQVSVAVIDRAEMANCLEQLNEAGIQPEAILPASLAVPFKNHVSQLQVEGNISYLRTAPQICHVFDTQNMALLLPKITADLSPDISLYITETEYQTLGLEFPIERAGDPVNKLAQLPDKTVLAMNLLQGNFQPQSDLQKYWRQWRGVVLLAVIVLVVQLTSVGIETWQLNQQVAKTKSEIAKVFHQAFPDEKRIVNPKAQMTQRLTTLQSQQDGTGFLMLLQQLGPALKASRTIGLTRINFERRLGEMRLDINAQDYAEVEQLKNKIEQLGLRVELGSVSGNKGAYTARLIIRGQQ